LRPFFRVKYGNFWVAALTKINPVRALPWARDNFFSKKTFGGFEKFIH